MVRGEFRNALYELGNSLFSERAQRHEGYALFLEIVRELRRQLGHKLLRDFVELVSRDEEGTLVKLGVVLAHLAAHDLEIFYDGIEIAAFEAQHMYQKPRPVHVAQEFEAEPLVLVRALDKAGDVRDDYSFVAGVYDAEVRRERREGIVRNLRLRVGDGGEYARLADVGQSYEAHVRDQAQFEAELDLLAHLALLAEARGFPRRACEVAVAAPSPAAARRDEAVVRLDEVCAAFAGLRVVDERPARDVDYFILARAPVPRRALSVVAVLALDVVHVLQVGERLKVRRRFEYNAASASAVAAVGAAVGLEALAQEAHAAVAAASGFDGHYQRVNEFHLFTS